MWREDACVEGEVMCTVGVRGGRHAIVLCKRGVHREVPTEDEGANEVDAERIATFA